MNAPRRASGSGAPGRLEWYDHLLEKIHRQGGIAARLADEAGSLYPDRFGFVSPGAASPDLIVRDSETGAVFVVQAQDTGFTATAAPSFYYRPEVLEQFGFTTPTADQSVVYYGEGYRPIKLAPGHVDIAPSVSDFLDRLLGELWPARVLSPTINPEYEHDLQTPRRPAASSIRVRIRVTQVAPRNRGALLSAEDWADVGIHDSAGDDLDRG